MKTSMVLLLAIIVLANQVNCWPWEYITWNFSGPYDDDKSLSDGDHIVLRKSCNDGVPKNKVRYDFGLTFIVNEFQIGTYFDFVLKNWPKTFRNLVEIHNNSS